MVVDSAIDQSQSVLLQLLEPMLIKTVIPEFSDSSTNAFWVGLPGRIKFSRTGLPLLQKNIALLATRCRYRSSISPHSRCDPGSEQTERH